MTDPDRPVYALNLFDIADRDEYLAYSRRSAQEVGKHGGPELRDLHPHRERGTTNYVWHLFEELEDLRPLLKA